MIGVISGNLIFEFRDEDDLAKALSHFSKDKIIIITEQSDKVKAILYDKAFTFPPQIKDSELYKLYITSETSCKDIQRNELLELECESKTSFIYNNVPIPTSIDKL